MEIEQVSIERAILQPFPEEHFKRLNTTYHLPPISPFANLTLEAKLDLIIHNLEKHHRAVKTSLIAQTRYLDATQPLAHTLTTPQPAPAASRLHDAEMAMYASLHDSSISAIPAPGYKIDAGANPAVTFGEFEVLATGLTALATYEQHAEGALAVYYAMRERVRGGGAVGWGGETVRVKIEREGEGEREREEEGMVDRARDPRLMR